MKKSKLLALIILLILIPMIAVITYFSPISKASSFVYQYGVTNGGPPFVTNIDGKQTEVYCSQAGGSLWSSWRLTFQSAETRNMSAGLAYAFRQCCSINSRQNLIWMSEIANNISTPDWHSDYDDALEQYNKAGLAYAFRQCCSINSRQNLIWMSEIANNISTPDWHSDYDDALEQYNKIASFNEYYKKLQEKGKDIKFEQSEAGLQSSENGVYKLGPFKLSFYKSSYSKISRLYLTTDTNETIEVKKVNFGGYTGSVEDIDSGEEFYVLLSQEEAKNASKVTLGAEYKYEEASGTYTYYVPTTPSMDGRTVQRLVTIDYTGGPAKDDATGPEIELTIDLAGKVFKDNLANKDGTEDGILSTGDEMLEGIEVTLFDSTGKEVAKTTTDKDGYYEFKDQLASRQYYVRFKYNGQLYEPTTYQRVSKIIDNSGTLGKTSIEERSYATDGKKNRQDFNNKFTPVDSTHEVPDRKDTKNPAFDIYAYTGPNGIEELLLYGVTNSKEELQNINFGIKDREQFDMNLRKDLVKVDLSINGKTHKYDYPGGEKDLEVEIRGTDIPDYNRAIRSADLKYKMQQQLEEAPDKLQVKVTYKIQLKNQSVGKITGYVTDLADYYDTSYEYIRSYDENEKEIAWEQQQDISGSGKTYHTMNTTALADQGIEENGVYKLGPFKLSFYKSSYSKISRLYLTTDTNETIEVKKVNFGGYTGSVEDIDSGEEFYVLLSQEEAKNASKVTLGAEYKYEEASGTYTYYVPTTPSMDGRTVQRLVTIDYTGGPAKDDATGPEIELTIDLAGKVFKDNLANKDGTEDGILSTGDEMLEGIEVTLFDSTGKEVAKTTTDKDGYYEFKDQLASRQYYVRFKYNGQLYEPTTYQRVSKIIDNSGTLGKTSIEERSYATDGKKNRQDFNNKFTPVDSTHEVPDRKDTKNPAFDIYAYTGPNGIEELLLYGVTNSKEELQNINFGIKDREQFDMNLRKDLVKVDLSINGKTHKYDYPGGEKDLEVEIRGTDIPDYNRAIRSADLKYKMQQQLEEAPDKLQVKVTYKIQLKNQSVGKITGYVTDLADYYDTSYEYIRSYDENEKEIAWEQQQDISGSGKTYHTMNTTALADQGIDDKKWIFVEYRVTDEALRALVEEGTSTKENFAQISGYKNT